MSVVFASQKNRWSREHRPALAAARLVVRLVFFFFVAVQVNKRPPRNMTSYITKRNPSLDGGPPRRSASVLGAITMHIIVEVIEIHKNLSEWSTRDLLITAFALKARTI